MEPSDYLLQAAVNWRGKPASFVSGELGDAGKAFDTAFGGLDYPADSDGSHCALEYFVGLIFNADYGDLEGLKRVVESWLTPVGRVIVIEDFKWDDYVFETALECPSVQESAYAGKTAQTEWISEPSNPFRIEIQFGINPRWPDLIGPMQICDYSRGWRRILSGFRGTAYPGSTHVLSAYWLMYGADHGHFTYYFGQEARAFKPAIEQAVRAYVEGELAAERTYPDMAATAATDNGFVFVNWAADKFGLPEAL